MKVKRILIGHAGGLGDLLLALPAMRLFCQNFSPYELELLGYPERLALISWDLKAQAMHSIDSAEIAYLFSSVDEIPSNLKAFFSSFEIALIFGQSWAKGLEKGLQKSGMKEILFLNTFPKNKGRIHIHDHLMADLKSFGIKGSIEKSPLQLPKEAEKFAHQFWAEKNIYPLPKVLAIHPGSGNPAKNWPAQNFAQVADYFADLAKILLISGPAPDGGQEVMSELKKAKPIMVHNLPLLKLAGLLKNCVAFIGNDSGITHLAASLGIPTLSIFGPTDPQVWGPQGEKVQVLYGHTPCSPCWPDIPHSCSRSCLYDLHAEMVIERLATWVEFAK
ncbi:MAG: glycosyltransferase family 9 protein [Thermodesulfobacteriota bacterium]